MTVAMAQVDRLWDLLGPAEQTRLLRQLVNKVTVGNDTLEVHLRAGGLRATADEMQARTEAAA
ncbi:hypothetical protein FE772_00895 [Lysobacter enzymogenes]|nr:hypothetical protein [Lysobacter enzymogenes]QCW24440.1 hypothetical protein FE772_00895 [Lysobacter enzymogenes]